MALAEIVVETSGHFAAILRNSERIQLLGEVLRRATTEKQLPTLDRYSGSKWVVPRTYEAVSHAAPTLHIRACVLTDGQLSRAVLLEWYESLVDSIRAWRNLSACRDMASMYVLVSVQQQTGIHEYWSL